MERHCSLVREETARGMRGTQVINMRKSLINHNATMDALVKEHERTAESQGAELARAVAAHQDLRREMEAAKEEMEAKLATTEQLEERALVRSCARVSMYNWARAL